MTHLYLVRHAEAEGNLYRIAQGQDNSNLTDRGWRQVRALERRLQEIHIDAVYSSDLYRTCATASAIYKPKGLPLNREPLLREIGVGVWERLTWGEIYRRWPEQMQYFSHEPAKWQIEKGEDPRAVQQRGLQAVREIAARHDGQTVAVVAHGYIIRLLMAHLQGYSMERAGESPTGDNTAVSLLEVENGEIRILFRDDNSHLKTPEFLAGEKVVKRKTAMEPGLWFRSLELPAQEELFCALAETAFPAGHFDRQRLLADAAVRPTWVGYLREEPVGILQLGPEAGWLSLVCIRPDQRKRGFGVQLIGQAVYRVRPGGVDHLRVLEPADEAGRSFFGDYGFHAAGRTEDGRVILEKNIGFDPEILGSGPRA